MERLKLTLGFREGPMDQRTDKTVPMYHLFEQ